MSDINLTTRLPVKDKAVNQVNIRNKGDDLPYLDVDIAPLSSKVIVEKTSSEGTGQYTTLQDFLFAKFCDIEILGQACRIRKEKVIKGEEDKDIILPDYYPVNVNAISIWQAWNDYQEILKRRLVGIYKDKKYLGDYIAADSENKEAIINFLCERYKLKDDYMSDGSLISKEQQAKILLMDFNQASFWQQVLDMQKKQKDILYGLYNNDGEQIGYFEKTRNNIDLLKNIYESGTLIKTNDINGTVEKIKGNSITTDAEAINLLLNFNKKSLAQHVLDLQDFWKTLAIEYYKEDSQLGFNIANSRDVKKTKNAWDTVLIKPSVGLEYTLTSDKTGYDVTGIGTCTDVDIVIPNEYEGLPVKGIRGNGLSKQPQIISVTFLEGIEYIESGLQKCDNLEKITISGSVRQIIPESISQNPKLIEIKVSRKNSHYQSIDGNLYSKDGKTFVQYATGKLASSFQIPEKVEKIESYAFYASHNLTEIELANNIAELGDYVFSSCESLECAKLLSSRLTSTGKYSFSYCKKLTLVEFADTIEEIGDSCFQDCDSQLSFEWPSSLKRIGSFTFTNTRLNLKDSSLTFPNGLETISGHAFNNCYGFKTVFIPDSVTLLGNDAFAYAQGMQEIILGSGLTEIKDETFYHCWRLTNIVFSKATQIKSIGDHAFYRCYNLQNIVIPASVINIGWEAFLQCNNLSSADFENPNGWGVHRYGENIELSSTKLADTATAAQYLKDIYCDDTRWSRTSQG